MLCAVYKSRKKTETYLFIERRDDFSRVPEALMNLFGAPELVTLVSLAPNARKLLRLAPPEKVQAQLESEGFYLHLPPQQGNLLEQHLAIQVAR